MTERSRRVCSRCGAPLSEGSGKHTALCPDCRAAAKRESVTRPRTCAVCLRTFLGGPRARYCPTCREERRREQDRIRRSSAGGPRRKLGSTDTCERCGAPYTVTGGRQRYCPDCAPDAVREAVAPHKREQARRYDPDHAKRRALHAGGRLCVICGAPIPPERTGTAVNTCSQECDAKRRKLRQYEADLRRGRKRNPPK